MEIERRIRWYQQALYSYLVNTPSARAIEVAHRRWGKDEIVLAAICELAHKRIGTYWHCLPEYAQARKALWTAVDAHTGKRRIFEIFPREICETVNEQEMFIRLRSGSTFQLIGSDRYDATVGAGPVFIGYSEWALANPSAWAYHRPMLEENGGSAAFITTPRGRNHAYTMYNRARDRDNWFAELSPITHTRALSDEQLSEALEEYVDLYGEDIGRAKYEQEYLCSFNAAIVGAFYTREMLAVRSEGRIKPLLPVPGCPVHTAWDIGVRDDTSIWWFQIYGGRLFILDCYTASGVGVDHYADICHQKTWPRGTDYVPHDAKVREWGSGKTRLESMLELGLNPRLVPMASKLDGINAVRKTLPLCIFDPACESVGVSALEQYRREWDDEKKTFRASEVRDWTTHLADAFRYLALAWRAAPVVEVKKKSQALFGGVVLPGAPEPTRGTRIKI